MTADGKEEAAECIFLHFHLGIPIQPLMVCQSAARLKYVSRKIINTIIRLLFVDYICKAKRIIYKCKDVNSLHSDAVITTRRKNCKNKDSDASRCLCKFCALMCTILHLYKIHHHTKIYIFYIHITYMCYECITTNIQQATCCTE